MSLSIDILLMGRTGYGKSATGNSILGRQAFESNASAESQTSGACIDFTEIEGRKIKVVDSPGLGDSRLDHAADITQFISAIKVAIASNPSGYHAILFVIRYGARYCKEDVESVTLLKKIMGNEFIRNHCILVLTFGDSFESDPDIQKHKLTFDEWVSSQKEKNFRTLVDECNNRVVLFDNRTRDDGKKRHQVGNLIKMIDNLNINGLRYTNKEFKEAERERERLLRLMSKPYLKEEHIRELSGITLKLSQIENRPEDMEKLENLRTRTLNLLKNIEDDDKGTGSLYSAIKVAKDAQSNIDIHIKELAGRLEQQKHQEKEKRELRERHQKLKDEKIANKAKKVMVTKFLKKTKKEYDKERKKMFKSSDESCMEEEKIPRKEVREEAPSTNIAQLDEETLCTHMDSLSMSGSDSSEGENMSELEDNETLKQEQAKKQETTEKETHDKVIDANVALNEKAREETKYLQDNENLQKVLTEKQEKKKDSEKTFKGLIAKFKGIKGNDEDRPEEDPEKMKQKEEERKRKIENFKKQLENAFSEQKQLQKEEEKRKAEQEEIKRKEEEIRKLEAKRSEDEARAAEDSKRRAKELENKYQELKKDELKSQGVSSSLIKFLSNLPFVKRAITFFKRK